MSKFKKIINSLAFKFLVPLVVLALSSGYIFTFYNLDFMYCIERAFFERELSLEAKYLESQYLEKAELTMPTRNYMTLYTSQKQIPPQLNSSLKLEIDSCELTKIDDRFYLGQKLKTHLEFFLIADVTDELLVRPNRHMIVDKLILVSFSLFILTFSLFAFFAYRAISPLLSLTKQIKSSNHYILPKNFTEQFPQNEIGELASALEVSYKKNIEFLEREKSFTRDVSHELRTSLASMYSAIQRLQYLLNTNEKDNELTDLTDRLSRGCLFMERTCNSLLYLAREDSVKSATSTFFVLDKAQQIVLDHHHVFLEKDVSIDIKIEPSQQLNTIEDIFEILLVNLMTNAFEHTDSGSITIELIKEKLIIKNPIQIEFNQSTSVLDPYAKKAQSTGFGIGLSIVKRLCKALNAPISISEENMVFKVEVDF